MADDVNDNGVVDMDDIQAVASAWGDIPRLVTPIAMAMGMDVVDIQLVCALGRGVL
ncbi:MAG: hypothetical protein IPF85_23825, partial [Anaerolineae bacterium]|nr:hypothetical protein [Anaerolineae bacterium]